MPWQPNIVIGTINNLWQYSFSKIHFSVEKTKILSFFLILPGQKPMANIILMRRYIKN